MPGFYIPTPAASQTGAGPSYTTESSRRHRYRVRLSGPLPSQLLFFAHKVTIPRSEIATAVMHHGQEEIILPGKHRWQTCEMSFYRAHDTNGDMAAREIYKWWSAGFVDLDESELVSGEGRDAGSPLAQIILEVLTGDGKVAYTYTMYGCWPQLVAHDPFDWSDSAVADVNVTFVVNKMKESPGSSPAQNLRLGCE